MGRDVWGRAALTFGDLGDVALLHGSGRAVNFGIQGPFGPIEADGEGGGLVHLQPRLLWGTAHNSPVGGQGSPHIGHRGTLYRV